MADSCDEYTLVGAGLTINDPTGDTLMLEEQDGVQGLDGVALRRTKPPQGQADGAILLTARKQFRIVLFKGFCVIRTEDWNEDQAAYRAAQQTLCNAWIAALDAIENTSDTLSWSGNSLTVYKDGGPVFSGPEFGKKFLLGFYAPDPTIT
jgi:hypothetical protein